MGSIVAKDELLEWFSLNLKRLRKVKGYSQAKLAELADMDVSYYGAVERGQRAITIHKLFHIASALEVPMCHFFSGEPTQCSNKPVDSLQSIITSLSKMEEEDISFFHKMLQYLMEWKNQGITNKHNFDARA